jgi:hypothetical protein
MRKEKWGKEEVTHWIDEHHCVDSALGWGAETSGISRESEVHVEADGAMAGAGVTGRHSSRSGQCNVEAGSVRERATLRRRRPRKHEPVMTYDGTSARHYSVVLG